MEPHLVDKRIIEAFKDDHPNNPDGYELVVFIGITAPIKGVLIGAARATPRINLSAD